MATLYSDDFEDGSFNTSVWTWRAGGANGTDATDTSMTESSGTLNMTINAGAGAHEISSSAFEAPCIVQTVENIDLSCTLQRTGDIASGTSWGMVFAETATKYIVIQVYRDGTSYNAVRVVVNGSWSDAPVTVNVNARWLKMVRTTNSWDAYYSTDGSSWSNISLGTSFTLDVNEVKVYFEEWSSSSQSMSYAQFINNLGGPYPVNGSVTLGRATSAGTARATTQTASATVTPSRTTSPAAARAVTAEGTGGGVDGEAEPTRATSAVSARATAAGVSVEATPGRAASAAAARATAQTASAEVSPSRAASAVAARATAAGVSVEAAPSRAASAAAARGPTLTADAAVTTGRAASATAGRATVQTADAAVTTDRAASAVVARDVTAEAAAGGDAEVVLSRAASAVSARATTQTADAAVTMGRADTDPVARWPSADLSVEWVFAGKASSSLTSEVLAAIIKGSPVSQKWTLQVPLLGDRSAYASVVIHDGPFMSNTISRVVRAGSRTHAVWNPHPNVTANPKAVRYTFEVANADGYFHRKPGGAFNPFGAYDASPTECNVIHQLSILTSSGWTVIDHMTFTGRIISIEYSGAASMNKRVGGGGSAITQEAPNTASITCEQIGAWDGLRRVFTKEDGDKHRFTRAAPNDYYWDIAEQGGV